MVEEIIFYGIGHNVAEVENLRFNWLAPSHHVFYYFENPCIVKGKQTREHACIIFGNGEERNYATMKNFVNSYVGFIIPDKLFASFGLKTNSVFYPKNFEDINLTIKEIANENTHRRINYRQAMCALLLKLLTAASRGIDNVKNDFDSRIIAMEKVRSKYLEDLAVEKDIDKLIAETTFSRTVFYELYQKFFHTTPKDDLIWSRLHHSRQLIVNTDMKIYEIAAACGFENIGHFSRTFSKRFGYTPKDYAKAVRKKDTQ